jgi:hypothetical protein
MQLSEHATSHIGCLFLAAISARDKALSISTLQVAWRLGGC